MGRQAIPRLVAELWHSNDDNNVHDGVFAAEALAEIGDENDVPDMLRAVEHQLTTQCAPDVRAAHAAILAVGKIGGPKALAGMIDLLMRPDLISGNRTVIVDVLATLSHGKAPPALLEAIADGTSFYCDWVAKALLRIGDPSSVPALVDALSRAEKKSPYLYNAISDALFHFGHPDGNFCYEETRRVSRSKTSPDDDVWLLSDWNKRHRYPNEAQAPMGPIKTIEL